ncbi:hypothetical protein LPW11_09820 [Geomonas sp. RF6]|uniref:hypothetical protein n=1 Tax=Geomonas sp. RF6 TaxID=2897342 RepID=UPI001E370A8B|nr:hypothetical protein [Geomonas sp. RF6]UFS72471.1 hypothetical protein LPW11_09820 [Geomonas sp. RF6]
MAVLSSELIAVFARSYEPPHWIVEGLLRSGDAQVRAALGAALEGIPDAAVAELDQDINATLAVMFHNGDHRFKAKLYLLSQAVQEELQQRRLAEITNYSQNRAQPYDHPVLRDVPVDADGLVPLSAFKINGDALCRGGEAFFILPAVPSPNANYWLLQNIARHGLDNAVSVRLDPLLHGPEAELAGHFYRMDVYGRPLDWDRIRALREPDHGRWTSGPLSRKSHFTDYAWIPHANEVDFICEELPPFPEVDIRGARYLHAVFDKQKNCLTHLDGAIRTYTIDELGHRAGMHVRNAGKIGQRVKVFRTDSYVDPAVMGDIVSAFFVWNNDVARYFSPSLPADL